MKNMFSYCTSLISIDFSNLNFPNIDDISFLFNECHELSYIDISGTELKKVQKYENSMFNGLSKNGTLIFSPNLLPEGINESFPKNWTYKEVDFDIINELELN